MDCYYVLVKGHIDKRRFRDVGSVDVELLPSGETRIICRQFDQAALHALLAQLRDLGLYINEVTRKK